MSDPTQTETTPQDPGAWPLVIVALLTGLAAWQWVTFGAPFGGDWAQYMSHARALVEGRDYGDIGYLFSPYAWVQGPPIYPPGLPLMLAPSVALFGGSLVVPRLFMHGLLAVFIVAAYRYFARDGDRTLAWGTAALLAASFILAGTPNVVGSDLGMCALVWLVLLLGEGSPRWSWRRALLIGVVGVLAINFRVAAAPLVPAVVLWALLHRRKAGWSPWVLGALWAAALVLVVVAFGPGEQAVESRTGNLGGPLSEVDGWVRWWGRMQRRMTVYRFAISDAYLYPFPVPLLNRIYHLVALPLTLIGLWDWVRRDWIRLGAIFAAGTAAMLLILPVWVTRYAWVLTPFVCYGLLRGLSMTWSKLPGGRPRGARVACAFAVLVAVLAAVADMGAPPGVREDAEDWRSVGDALRAGAADTSALRVVSNRPRVLTWFTRIPAAGLPTSSFDRFLEETQRLQITRVVVSTQQPDERAYRRWIEWNEEQPEVFRPLGAFGDLRVFAIEFDRVRRATP